MSDRTVVLSDNERRMIALAVGIICMEDMKMFFSKATVDEMQKEIVVARAEFDELFRVTTADGTNKQLLEKLT